MEQLKEGIDFNYVIPESEEETVGIKILKGTYADTVYQYGKVKFEEESDGAVYLRFVYNVTSTPSDKESLESDADFKQYIGDILVNIMTTNMNKGMIDEVGTDYSEESDSQ